MAQPEISGKRLAISKANAQMVIIMSVASFVTVFCLIASHAIWGQTRYQARVTAKDEVAKKQLNTNIQAFDNLVNSYQKFNSATTNVIGGSSTGSGPNDGPNAKIVLDALPGAYDFPALTSSVAKILNAGSFDITSIGGTDDQLNQQNNTSSPNPTPVPMPFTFTVSNSNYVAVTALISVLQDSIRPIQINTIDLTGGSNNMVLTVSAQTYYQPAKSLSITKQVVK